MVGIVLYQTYSLCVALSEKAGSPADATGMFCHMGALAVVLGILTANRRWRLVGVALRSHAALYAAIALLGSAVAWTSVHGLALSSLSSLAILAYTDILFTILLGWLLFHEKIGWAGLLGASFILAGATVRIAGHQAETANGQKPASQARAQTSAAPASAAAPGVHSETAPLSPQRRRLAGDLFFVAYGFFLALNAFLIKRLLGHVTWDVILLGNYSGRLAVFSALALSTGQAKAGWAAAAGSGALPWILGAGGLFAAAGMMFYYHALRLMPVWMVKVFGMTGTMVCLLYDYLFFGRAPRANTLLGAALVIGGALCVLRFDPLFHPAAGRTPPIVEGPDG